MLAGLECLGEFFEILSLTLQNDRGGLILRMTEGMLLRMQRGIVLGMTEKGVSGCRRAYYTRARATLITRVFMRAYINCTRVSALVSRSRARIFARVRVLCLRIMRAHAKKI